MTNEDARTVAGDRAPVDSRALLEAVPALVWEADDAGRVTYYNRRWSEFAGVSEEALATLDWRAFVHPDDLPGLLRARADARRACVAYEFEYRLRDATGRFQWHFARVRPIVSAGGAARGARWIGVAANIDAQKRDALALAFLAEAGQAIAAEPDLETALRSVAELAVPSIADYCLVLRANDDGTYAPVTIADRDPARAARVRRIFERFAVRGGPIAAAALATNDVVVLPRVEEAHLRAASPDDAYLELARDVDFGSLVIAPLAYDGRRFGIIEFVCDGVRRAFGETERRLAADLAKRVAVALENAALVRGEQRAADDLRFLADMGSALVESLDLTTRLETLVNAVVPRLADWATVNLRGDDGALETVAIAHRSPAAGEIVARLYGPYYGAISSDEGTPEALRTGRPQLLAGVDDAFLRRHIRPDAFDDVRALGADSAFIVPLLAHGRAYGTLSAMRSERERSFSPRELRLIEELARQAAIAIANARLFERSRSVGDAFQHASLPASLPRVTGLAFDAYYSPGSDEAMVGGDWYDAFRVPDGRIVLSIGDVSGSGLSAAVVMGTVRQLVRGVAQVRPDAREILDATDKALRSQNPEQLVTAFVGILDPVAMTLAYASAGHPPPLVREPDGTLRALSQVGLPLGLRGADEPPETVVSLADGSLVVLYTDGLVESTRDWLEGERRLLEVLGRPAVARSARPARAIHDGVLPERAFDDVALLTVTVRGGLRRRFDTRDQRAAREALAGFLDYLRAHGRPGDDYDGAALVFMELLGNAVRHAPGPVDVTIEWPAEAPVLHVVDDGPGFHSRPPARPTDVLSETGRGLFLVAAFADGFDVERRPGGGSHARAVLKIRRQD